MPEKRERDKPAGRSQKEHGRMTVEEAGRKGGSKGGHRTQEEVRKYGELKGKSRE